LYDYRAFRGINVLCVLSNIAIVDYFVKINQWSADLNSTIKRGGDFQAVGNTCKAIKISDFRRPWPIVSVKFSCLLINFEIKIDKYEP
jgi:hypothetical protein